MCIVVSSCVGLGARALAQSEDDVWATPVNLSQSGVASGPAIVLVPDGTLRVFWWDRFDGIMVTDGMLAFPTAGETQGGGAEGPPATPVPASAAWSAPRRATIQIPETVQREGQEVVVLTPIQAVPKIVGDASGRAHAFWLGEPDADTGNTPLLYSRLNPDSTSWSTPSSLAASAGSFAVIADIGGAVHLLYVQAKPAPNLPVGLYYRQLPAGGSRWITPTDVHRSRYLRLLSPDEDSLRVTADDEGTLYAAWDDPSQERILLARSTDRGATWSEPEPHVGTGIQPEQDRVIELPGSARAVLWAPAGEPNTRIVASSAGNALRLAAWEGARWSTPTEMLLRFEDPESGKQVRLNDLGLALMPPSSDDEEDVETLVVVGLDDNSDLWIVGARVDALEQLLDRPAIGADLSTSGAPVPVNLSQSGAASNPAIVARSDGTLYVFWEDQFDGLMEAEGIVVAASVLSGTEQIPASREIWSEPQTVPILPPETGTQVLPQIVADAAGRIHAFWWLAPEASGAAGQEIVARPLLHSQLAEDGSAWSAPAVLAEAAAAFDVAAEPTGALHIAYIETSQTPSSPAGVYYRRLEQGRVTWSAPISLQQSRYFRLLTPEAAHLRLAADEAGSVYVTWDDPQQEGLMLAYSPDGGATWQEPTTVGSEDRRAQKGRFIPVPAGETQLLWEGEGSAGPCNLFQAPVRQVVEGAADAGRPVLEELGSCPVDETFLSLGEEQVLIVLGSGTDVLSLAVWDGSLAEGNGEGQWSEPCRLSFSFEDPTRTRQIYLGNLQAALVELHNHTDQGLAGKSLVAVGTDQDGDVWVTTSEMGALDVVFAPPPPWSPPVDVSESEAHPDLPAMAADLEGQVHLLWREAVSANKLAASLMYARWDGERWSRPSPVLQSPEGGVGEPAIVTEGDRLHAVWGSQGGEIFYSHAFTQDAYSAQGWSEPKLLSTEGSVANGPDLVVDEAGGLYVVFAVPVNEGRGIYYTHSGDGDTWTPPRQVFDAARAGWVAVSQPRVAVDPFGFIHVVWVRTPLPGSGLPEGVYYARSLDGGETWSEAWDVAIGEYGWPQAIAITEGQVHVVWQEVDDQSAWWHRLSSDAGQTWTRPQRLMGFGNVGAPVRLLAEANGALHLLGLSQEGEGVSTLLHATWDGGRWNTPKAFRLEVDGMEAGISAALAPTLRRLDVVFRGEAETEEAEGQVDLWHTGRQVPTVAVTPAPTFVPQPTATPTATPAPTPTLRPTPSFTSASPDTEGAIDPLLPMLLAGGSALLIVGAVVGTRAFLAGRR